MSTRRTPIVEIVSRYALGYFPLYDLNGLFYWERLPLRAVLPMTAEVAGRARRMKQRAAKRFEIRHDTAIEEVIERLRDEEIKPRTWVKEEIVEIYSELERVGLLRTVEAWDKKSGRLVGGLLGLVLPGTFVAETMYGLVPEASKACLCTLVEECFAAGYEMIDVQTPHDLDELGNPRVGPEKTAHPCMRLGEIHLPIGTFMKAFAAGWKERFEGGVEEWIAKMAEKRGGGR